MSAYKPTFANDPYAVPIPTNRPPPTRKPTNTAVRRAKTLTRPERSVAPVPLINPRTPIISTPGSKQPQRRPPDDNNWEAWSIFAHIITFWAPPFILSSIGGIRDRQSRQAWREKIALCSIALLLGSAVGFATTGLDRVLCPLGVDAGADNYISWNTSSLTLGIEGFQFNITDSLTTNGFDFFDYAATSGQDITDYFLRSQADYPACIGQTFAAAKLQGCCNPTDSSCLQPCALGALNQATYSQAGIVNTTKLVGFDWYQVAELKYYFVLDGNVLNLESYMTAHKNPVANDEVDIAIRTLLAPGASQGGKDATRLFYNNVNLKAAIPCLEQRYLAGNIDKITPGCFASQLVLYAALIVIMGLVLVRFAMACVFSWFLSSRLVAPPRNLSRTVISPAVMPEGANVAVDSKNGTAPWARAKLRHGAPPRLAPPPRSARSTTTTLVGSDAGGPSPLITMAHIGVELFCVCLVTCYSEGEESIRGTLDSISSTNYADARKLLFVVADGMITGAGEKRSTPDICVGLLDADPRFGNPLPLGYVAIGLGAKRENRAMVYAGHYTVAGRRTPTIIIVKCGTDQEALTDKKPGNRGKRDSQLILMNFFSRVTYNDRMTPLDYDVFRKMQVLMGVTPDFFEVCLMVDADTKVAKDSIKHLVNCLHHDKLIMGVCGETRIANKRQSWVTAIQVYEYFISHHLAKAFESVFGGVTCLPGCFSMYRLKVRKATDDDWVPLLTKPEITREYSQSDVRTLHQKNLLLLGEDRFLTTILLRTFPNRKMVFCPQARCRTVAPDSFRVLLSQRRRWINSTVHNLMELVRVRNLCGTFCFSMQFVVFMDLIGTTVLPVAITLTYVLIANMAINPPNSFEKAIPLMLLLAVIGLPAVLILLTTRKIVYIFWMFIYLAALPIWNFVLPVYSFWHFDDFSWGETRKVQGERQGAAHNIGAGDGAGDTVPMRRWEDWERSRLRKLKREEKRRRELERAYPGGYPGFDAGQDFLRPYPGRMDNTYESSDTTSIISTDEDQWGTQIGGYNEHSAQYPPPPVGLHAPEQAIAGAETVGKEELEAMLESGWDDRPQMSPSSSGPLLARAPQSAPRYQLSDSMQAPTRSPTSGTVVGDAATSAVGHDYRTHVKKRSQGGGAAARRADGYGPLGPLDPGEDVPGSPYTPRRF